MQLHFIYVEKIIPGLLTIHDLSIQIVFFRWMQYLHQEFKLWLLSVCWQEDRLAHRAGVYDREKKENLPLPVVISLMDLSIYLYLSAYLKSNKPSYISYFGRTVRFWTPMWIFFLLCTKSYVASTSFFLSGTIFSQLYLPTCSS